MSQASQSPSMGSAAVEGNDYYKQAREIMNAEPRVNSPLVDNISTTLAPVNTTPVNDGTVNNGPVNSSRPPPSRIQPNPFGNSASEYDGPLRVRTGSNKEFGTPIHPEPRNQFVANPRPFEPQQDSHNTGVGLYDGYKPRIHNQQTIRQQSNQMYDPEPVAEKIDDMFNDFGRNSYPRERRPSNNSRTSFDQREVPEYIFMAGVGEETDMTHDTMDMESRDSFRAISQQHQGQKYQQSQLQDYESDQESESMFVEDDERPRVQSSYRVQKSAEKRTPGPRRFAHDSPLGMSSLPRHPGRHATPPPFESHIGSNKRSSRYSGMKDDYYHVNKYREPIDPNLTLHLPNQPPIRLRDNYINHQRRAREDDGYAYSRHDGDGDEYDGGEQDFLFASSPLHSQPHNRSRANDRDRDRDQSTPIRPQRRPKPRTRVQKVTKASLSKRGLKEGQEEEVLLRGYGVNDPENVEIVNLKESGDYTFDEIARILNERRLEEGRDPKLTTTGVNGRYNRTAPTLFESQGLYFVPLLLRKKDPAEARKHGKPIAEVGGDGPQHDIWNPAEHDKILVDAVREYAAEKWTVVAQKFAAKAGFAPPEGQLAKRFVLL